MNKLEIVFKTFSSTKAHFLQEIGIALPLKPEGMFQLFISLSSCVYNGKVIIFFWRNRKKLFPTSIRKVYISRCHLSEWASLKYVLYIIFSDLSWSGGYQNKYVLYIVLYYSLKISNNISAIYISKMAPYLCFELTTQTTTLNYENRLNS